MSRGICIVDCQGSNLEPQKPPPGLWIIHGPVNGGKTSCLKSLMPKISKVSGVLAEGIFENERKTGYAIHVFELGRNTAAFDFQINKNPVDPIYSGSVDFDFDQKLFDRVTEHFIKQNYLPALMIDELGPLEIERQLGWWRLFQYALDLEKTNIFVTVRDRYIKHLLELVC